MTKINLYKNSLIDFEKKERKKEYFINDVNFTEIDYIIGILFLTEMNIYCKLNNFTAHGYYVACSLMVCFNCLNNIFKNDSEFSINNINFFWISIFKNILHLKEKINNSPTIKETIKHKIKDNFDKFMLELSLKVDTLVANNNKYFKEISTNKNLNKYDWIENVYSVFFYILLAIAKFFGSGDFKDHNLERLADYYTNIFIIYYKSGNITADNSGIELLDMFLTYQVKINTSLIELNLNSETLDEIINYLSDSIRNNLNIDEKPIL
jgi:hypothetical protein